MFSMDLFSDVSGVFEAATKNNLNVRMENLKFDFFYEIVNDLSRGVFYDYYVAFINHGKDFIIKIDKEEGIDIFNMKAVEDIIIHKLPYMIIEVKNHNECLNLLNALGDAYIKQGLKYIDDPKLIYDFVMNDAKKDNPLFFNFLDSIKDLKESEDLKDKNFRKDAEFLNKDRILFKHIDSNNTLQIYLIDKKNEEIYFCSLLDEEEEEFNFQDKDKNKYKIVDNIKIK